jgi:serralysin
LAFTTTVGAGGTSLIGTSGVDTTTFAPGTLSTAVFIGAQGDADFVTLQTNQASNYTIRGGAGVDTITAAGLNNSILTGDDGNDVITINTNALQNSSVSGLEGNDNIAVQSNVNGALANGNNGNDTFVIGTAAGITFTNNAKIVGGQGNDTFTIGAGAVGNVVTLTSGLINGQDGDDTITISAIGDMTFGGGATIYGGQGSDIITQADTSNSIVSGDLGADNITTGGGRDTVFGGEGNDRIAAGNRADSISGGSGTDTFVQGVGTSARAAITTANSVYTFAGGVDTITDFAAGANGDILSMGGAGAVAPTVLTVGAGLDASVTAIGVVYAVSGNLRNGVFTAAAGNTGSDTLLITGTAASTFGADISAVRNQIVLSGVNVAQLVGANFS